MKKIFTVFILLFLFICCNKSNIKQDIIFRFAVTGNTSGESPYDGPSQGLGPLINAINNENPVFLVHTGGLVCGGSKWRGLSKSDIEKQYKEIFQRLARLSPILDTVKSETDINKDAGNFYFTYSKRPDYYSFNFENVHFVVLDSSNWKSASSGIEQIEWLKNDLKLYKKFPIIIFINRAFFYQQSDERLKTEINENFKELHDYFKQYNAKAVISGNDTIFLKEKIDGIDYINAGCSGLNESKKKNKGFQFYIIEYKAGELSVIPRNIK